MAEAIQTRRPKSPAKHVVDFVSGFHVAVVCLGLLGILTWLGTLEQTDNTLLEVTKKYFSYETFFLFPELNGRTIYIPLPNGFWVGLVFFFNLLLGTILRVRRGWKQVGVLISHFGMLLLLVGAFVTQVWSQRGNMAISEGEVSDTAQHYYDHVIEVAEIKEGGVKKVHVIKTKHLADLEPDDRRLFKMKGLPFDLRVTDYHVNSEVVKALDIYPEEGEEIVDGFILRSVPKHPKEAERNLAGCHVEIVPRKSEEGAPPPSAQKVIVSSRSVQPATIRYGSEFYTVHLRKALWKMPFEVKLNKFTHEFHPGTMRPKRFESDIERLEDNGDTPVLIRMNHPMRHKGYTFFQASWGPQDDPTAKEFYSVFEVVKNPADHWPLIALIITGIGLAVQFLMKLGIFIYKQFPKNA